VNGSKKSAASALCAALDSPARESAVCAAYDAARRREFGGKWVVERMVGAGVAFAPVVNRAVRALAARKDMADLLVGVTGDFVPAREVLRPGYLARLFLAPIPTTVSAWR
jgi:menaquinone-9 beta-reductase